MRLRVDRAALGLTLGLALALLAVAASAVAPGLGAARTPLLVSGCAGPLVALALFLPRGGASGRPRDVAATFGLLLALCACIVLILVCAVATGPVGE
jgi:hypothetical protein